MLTRRIHHRRTVATPPPPPARTTLEPLPHLEAVARAWRRLALAYERAGRTADAASARRELAEMHPELQARRALERAA